MEPEYLAAVDIGTNSFHMAIVRPGERGNFEIITREKEAVRLASGSGDLESISPEAMERGLQVLGRFAALARSHDAPLKAVATSAVREAPNGPEFVRRAFEEFGVRTDVISGVEEARLIYRGVLGALPVRDKRILMVDIGGGSTEFLIGLEGRPLYANSLKLGAIRLTERFFPGGEIRRGALSAARQFIRVALTGVRHEIRKREFELAVGCSGTVETLLDMIRGELNGTNIENTFTDDQLYTIVEKLSALDTPRKRVQLPGLDERRADIIVGGAVLLAEIFRSLKIKSMQVSPYALREGIIFDQLYRRGKLPEPAADATGGQDLRRSSTLALIDRMRPYPGREQLAQCARLAGLIFEQLRAAGLSPEMDEGDALLLETGTMLHNIGQVIAHSAHHKHGYYIIKHTDLLLGFAPREIEIIALLARYHRKADPNRKHAEFAALSEPDQDRLNRLAGILRIAISLNRTGKSLIEDIRLEATETTLRFRLQPVAGAGPAQLEVDLWAADLKKGLFERAFARGAEFVIEGAEA